MQVFAALVPPAELRAQVLRGVTGVVPTDAEIERGHIGGAARPVLPGYPQLRVTGPLTADQPSGYRMELDGDLDGLHALFAATHRAAGGAGCEWTDAGSSPASGSRRRPRL